MKISKHPVKRTIRPLERTLPTTCDSVDVEPRKKANRALKSKIDTSALAYGLPKQAKDNKYLNYIRGLKCVFCGKSKESGFEIHPHHLPNKKGTRRNDDRNTIPLCFVCHRYIHDHPNAEKDLLGELERKAFNLRGEYDRR